MVNFLAKLSVSKGLHRVGLHVSAIYFNSLSTRIFMISNCYLDSEGESAWQDSPL